MPSSKPKQAYKKKKDAVGPIDGEWITDPPFTLPPGVATCPSPTCSGNKRTFRPYWRLNEHMKLRHGWPRKQTQPNLDRRLGNQWPKKKKKVEEQSGDDAGNDEQDEDDENGNASDSDPLTSLEPSPDSEHPETKTHVTDLTGNEPNLFFSHYSSRPPTLERPHALEQDAEMKQDVDMEDAPNSSEYATSVASEEVASEEDPETESAIPEERTTPVDTSDPLMLAVIKERIDELQADIDRTPASANLSDVLRGRKTLKADLQNIVEQNYVQVNTLVPAVQARALWPYYQALATRAEYNSTKSRAPPLPLTTSVAAASASTSSQNMNASRNIDPPRSNVPAPTSHTTTQAATIINNPMERPATPTVQKVPLKIKLNLSSSHNSPKRT